VARGLVTRLPFLIAAALIAAACADPVVESIANTGILGGDYADTTRTGIIPTLLVGFGLVLELLALRCIAIWRASRRGVRDPFMGIARDFATHSVVRDLPVVFALQLLAVFVMESAEQLTTGGTFLGGTAWLGGPVLFSLFTHAMFGAGCLVALGSLMRWIVRAFAAVVQTAIRFIWLAIARACHDPLAFSGRETPRLGTQAPRSRQIGGRAPPIVAITA
jgi:hypothetical protein